MTTEEVIKVQTTMLKVNINYDGCKKRVKKILHNIEGVYQSRIDAEQGKVAVFGLDVDTIIKKLRKAGKSATSWGSNPNVVSDPQNLKLDGGGQSKLEHASDKGQLEEACGTGQNGHPTMGISVSLDGPAIGVGRSVDEGSRKNAKIAMPGQIPQQLQQLQQKMQQQQQMRGMKIPPQPMGGKKSSSATAQAKNPRSTKFNVCEDEFDDEGSDQCDDDFDEFAEDEDSEGVEGSEHKMMMMMAKSTPLGSSASGGSGGGMKRDIVNEIPIPIKGNASNTVSEKRETALKQSLSGVGAHGKNRSGGQQLQNIKGGAVSSANQQGLGMQGSGRPMMGSSAVGGPMGGALQPQTGMMSPRNRNMLGASAIGGRMGGTLPAQPGMTRPPNPNMLDGAPMNMPMGHPHMGGMPQPGGAVNGMPAVSMPGAGFYHGSNVGGGGGGGLDIRPNTMHHVATSSNLMTQQEHMVMLHHHQQQQQMTVNNGHNGVHQGHGGAGMGYGYGHPHQPMHNPMGYPTQAESYNIFSDENPNNCSVM